MRTTVDLPPTVRQRAQQIADQQGRSLSATVADLAIRGLAQLDMPVEIEIDVQSGFPTISVGRVVSDDDVSALIDEP